MKLFCHDLLMGLGVARDGISHFAIDLRRRPYITLVRACDALHFIRQTPLLFSLPFLECTTGFLLPISINGSLTCLMLSGSR